MQYIIATLPRSGSFMLCDLLQKCGAGKPDEDFHPFRGPFAKSLMTANSTEEYVTEIKESRTHNGIFSTKVMSNWLGNMRSNMESPTKNNAEMLELLFPDTNYIFLTRKNRVRQAISFCRAVDTGQWSKSQGQQSQQWKAANFNDNLYMQIRSTVLELLQWKQIWVDTFHSMSTEPLQLYYEDLVSEPEKMLKIVCTHIGVNPSRIQTVPTFQRQSDTLTDELTEKFLGWDGFKTRTVSIS